MKYLKTFENINNDAELLIKLSGENLLDDVMTTKRIKELINSGVDVNYKNNNGDFALMNAVIKNKEIIVNILLEAGADVNMDDAGNTPLLIASEINRENIALLLINAGADINAKCEHTLKTPLMLAAETDKVGLFMYLIRKGADLTYKDKKGKTFVDYADFDVVKRLQVFDLQEHIFSIAPELYNNFITAHINIHPDIYKVFPHLKTGADLNLL